MPTIKIDADGVPYWDQPVGSRWDYSVDWTNQMRATEDAVASSVWSAITSGLAVASNAHTASGVHTMWLAPSEGNAGASYYFRSKVFTTKERIEVARIKVNVV